MKYDNYQSEDHTKEVRMVPFTTEELQNVQLTLLSKMVQLSHDIHEGKIPADTADTELKALGQTSEKVSRYCRNNRTVSR